MYYWLKINFNYINFINSSTWSKIWQNINRPKRCKNIKTLGKWFNDVYNKRELYSYSKRLSLYIYKKQTKYSRQMHRIYHVSWFTYLYSTQSFSSKLQRCSRLAFSLGYMSLDNRPRVALGFRSVVILRIQPIITITTVSYSVLKGDIEVQSIAGIGNFGPGGPVSCRV